MSEKNIKAYDRKDVPVRREEEHPFALLQRDINALFDNFFKGFGLETFESRAGIISPRIDIIEGDREIKVSAELPGVDEKDIEVSLTKDTLTIKGEKKESREDKGKDYYRMERSYGSFTRTIPLPTEIDTEKVDAAFKKGILTITLPKTAKAVKETKKIAVKSE